MLPKNLALIDDDKDYTEFLSQFLTTMGIAVEVFSDGNDLLAHAVPYDFDFYLVDLMLPGVDGVNLIKIIRKRSAAGVLVVSGKVSPEVFKDVINAGADMFLAKPVQFEQVALAIQAVKRRVVPAPSLATTWRLDRQAGQLVAPDGVRVDLSGTDAAVIECFVAAAGEVVAREALRQHLGKDNAPEAADGLNATIYRLRRRIERATPAIVPLHSKSGVGYQFKAPLTAI